MTQAALGTTHLIGMTRGCQVGRQYEGEPSREIRTHHHFK